MMDGRTVNKMRRVRGELFAALRATSSSGSTRYFVLFFVTPDCTTTTAAAISISTVYPLSMFVLALATGN
jgi:hypothetical protein